MLKLYSYLDTITEQQNNHTCCFESKLNYFASEIMQNLEVSNPDEIKNSFDKAFQVYATLNIPFKHSFKKVFRYDGASQIVDWKISSLACYTIIINSNTSNKTVAKDQQYFATKIKPN